MLLASNLIKVVPQKVNALQFRVDPFERKEIAEEIKSMMSLANRLSTEDRFQRRREIFESSKARKGFNYASE